MTPSQGLIWIMTRLNSHERWLSDRIAPSICDMGPTETTFAWQRDRAIVPDDTFFVNALQSTSIIQASQLVRSTSCSNHHRYSAHAPTYRRQT